MEEEEEGPSKKPAKKSGAKKKSSKRFDRFDPNDLSSLLADAEEFSHLLEQNDDEGNNVFIHFLFKILYFCFWSFIYSISLIRLLFSENLPRFTF